MKRSDIFLKEVQDMKAGMNINEESLSNSSKVIILERKKSKLEYKLTQIKEEIEKEIEDCFDYLSMKQANIETLGNMDTYINDEISKVEQLIEKIKVANNE